MKTNEIRIGNLIWDRELGKAILVSSIHYPSKETQTVNLLPASRFEGMPITEDVLRKIFWASDVANNLVEVRGIVLETKDDGTFYLINYPDSSIRFIHELQNAIFILTGYDYNLGEETLHR